MTKKKVPVVMAAVLVCALASGSAYAMTVSPTIDPSVPTVSAEAQLRDLIINSGTISNGTGLNETYTLSPSNGRYINLYVENTGSVAVVASINGQSQRTFQPGQKGHISITASWYSRNYQFKATPLGGQAEMFYAIAQRDNPVG